MPTYAEVVAQLTGPGAPFEVVTETVAGRPQKNWKHREQENARCAKDINRVSTARDAAGRSRLRLQGFADRIGASVYARG
jgi:hypothetical protein